MMSLELQFRSVAASFFYGLFMGFGYGFFNRACFHMRLRIGRTLLEIIHDSLWLTGYFFMMVWLNHGHFNLYLYLALALGTGCYIFALSAGYLMVLERLMSFFYRLFFPFRFIFRRIHAILRHVKKVTKGGSKKKRKTE